MSLSRGPRVFHVNSENDAEKLDGWLRRGPKYTAVTIDSRSPRKLYLRSSCSGLGSELVGIVVVMSQTFTKEKVLPLVERRRSSR